MARGRVSIGRKRNAGSVTIDPVQFVRVSTKTLWSDARWVVEPWVYPVKATFALPPAISSAMLEYEYGKMRRPGYSSEATYDLKDLIDHYVKIEVFPTEPDPDSVRKQQPLGVWHGIIVEEDRGPEAAASESVKQGWQRLRAYGLEYLLTKVPVDTSAILHPPVSFYQNRQHLIFNQSATSGRRRSNMSALLQTLRGAPTFITWPEDDTGIDYLGASEWDLASMALYLLTYFASDRLAMEFKPATFPDELATIKPIYDPFDKSVFDCLSELFGASRGLSWHLEVAEAEASAGQDPVDPDLVEMHVHSTLIEQAVVGDLVVPANPQLIPRLMDSEIRIVDGGLHVVESTAPRYKTVRIEGAPIVMMFSGQYADGTLTEDWSSSQSAAYDAAASAVSGYGSLSFAAQAAANDEARRRNEAIRTVYLRHRFGRGWLFKGGRNPWYAGYALYDVVPFVSANGTVELDTPPIDRPMPTERRLLNWLPIRRGYDYSVNPVVEVESLEGEYEAPKFFVEATKDGRAHRLYELHDLPATYPRFGLRLLTGEMGFELTAGGGTPHRAGLNHFSVTSAAATMEAPRKGDSIDYQTLVATVAVELDSRPHVTFSPFVFVDNDETLVITLPFIQYWAASRQAIVGVSDHLNDTFVVPRYVHEDSRVLRDDTDQLRAIAAFARDWFSLERRIVDVTLRRIDHVPLGAILQAVTYGGRLQQVNTIISSVTWDFHARSPRTGPTTRIMTSHRELHFAGLFGGQPLRMSRVAGRPGPAAEVRAERRRMAAEGVL